MFGAARSAVVRKDHAACSGCSLCLLVCPVWRQTHDPRLAPEGRAKAIQHGAPARELAASVAACRLCGACEPVCPEEIDLVGMTLGLRTQLAEQASATAMHRRMLGIASHRLVPLGAKAAFLPGPALRAKPQALARISTLLGAKPSADDGVDIEAAFQGGIPIPRERLDRFLGHLRAAREVVVEDGLWMRSLHKWLPNARLSSLGEALSNLDAVRRSLRKTDLYVIEPRAYHYDYERLVKHYDRLRAECGCAFNLDLQRIAIPAATQADWILKGLRVDRVVVERLEDAEAFVAHGAHPVVHLAELADH